MARKGIAANTLEQERQDALDSIAAGLAEKPHDRITKLACAYLLRHLRQDAEQEHWLPSAA